MAKRIFNIFSKFGINGQDDNGRTKLYKAAQSGNVSSVKRLLLSDAKPNIKNNRGLTPLHQAVYWGEVEIVKALLNAGADPKADNGKGWTPLHSASLSAGLPRRKQIIKMLIDAGGDVDKEDSYGWSPKDYMQLWIKHDKSNLKKLQRVMDNKDFLDDVQQPDITKLGLEKNKPEPPAHQLNNNVPKDDNPLKKPPKNNSGSNPKP